jgi:hypothetical protein
MEYDEPDKLSWWCLMPAGIGSMIQFDVGISSSGPTPSVKQHFFGTTTAAFTGNQTVGNLNVVFVFGVGTSGAGGSTITCSDTIGNTYSAVGTTCTVPGGSTAQVGILVCTSIKATTSSNTVTPAISGSLASIKDTMIIEFGGAVVGWTLDTGSQLLYTATSSPSISITTANANELLVGAVGDTTAAVGTYTAPSLWNQIDNQTGTVSVDALMDAWQQGGAAGSPTFAPTSSVSLAGNIGLVAVRIQ